MRCLLFAFVAAVVACAGERANDAESDPSGSGGDGAGGAAPMPGPVPVFLMAGQSNMEGYGPLDDADAGDWPLSGSLSALIASGAEDGSILSTRDDVWVHFDSDSVVHAPGFLEPGFGASVGFIGPELGFGEVLGNAWEEPIVLYKTATGGTTLGLDWRPPSAGGPVGPLYERMITGFQSFLASEIAASFPKQLAERGYRVAGFVWLQGWNDQFEDGFVEQYEDNLVALVQDVRSVLQLTSLPALIVEGPTLLDELRSARVAAVARLNAEQADSAFIVETNDLVDEDLEGNFHFHFNAKNYLEVGRRSATAILQ